MTAEFLADHLLAATCERGRMALSPAVIALLNEQFFGVSQPRPPRDVWAVGSPWFCPADGEPLRSAEEGESFCRRCGRVLSGRLWRMLVELHPHGPIP
jgi:hypothetical protein